MLFVDSVELKFFIDFSKFTGEKENITVVLTYTNVNGVTKNEKFTYADFVTNVVQGEEYQTFVYRGIAIKDMGRPVQVEIFENYGTPEQFRHSGVYTYSIETYAANRVALSTNAIFVELCKYMMAYSRSTAEFLGK